MKDKIQALGENIIVKLAPEIIKKENQTDGIYMPTIEDEDVLEVGTVVSFGKEADGLLSEGEVITFDGSSSRKLKHAGEEYVVTKLKNIIAKI